MAIKTLMDLLTEEIIEIPGAQITPLNIILGSLVIATTYLVSRYLIVPGLEKLLEKIGIEKEDRKTFSKVVHLIVTVLGFYFGSNFLIQSPWVLLTMPLYTAGWAKITPLSILLAFFAIFGAYMVSRFILSTLLKKLLKKIDIEEKNRAKLLKTTHYLILFGGFYAGMTLLNVEITAVLSTTLLEWGGAQINFLRILLAAVTFTIIYLLSKYLITNILDKALAKAGTEEEDRETVLKVLHYLIIVGGVYSGINVLNLKLDIILNVVLFSVAGTQVTPLDVVSFALAVTIAYLVSKFVITTSIKKVLADGGVPEEDIAAVTRVVHYFVVFLGIYIGLNFLGIQLTALLAVAGITGIVLGFGLQPIIANLISGFLLMAERTVRVGDWIEFDGMYGVVVDTGIRASTLRTIDNRYMLIPNRTFVENPFTNYSHRDKKIRISIPVGVAYGTDVEKVKEILTEIAEENEQVLDLPEPNVFFNEFGDSAYQFELACWISDPKYRKKTKSEINFEIRRRFREEGIEIPFPQTDVWLKKDQGMTEEEIEEEENF